MVIVTATAAATDTVKCTLNKVVYLKTSKRLQFTLIFIDKNVVLTIEGLLSN